MRLNIGRSINWLATQFAFPVISLEDFVAKVFDRFNASESYSPTIFRSPLCAFSRAVLRRFVIEAVANKLFTAPTARA
jgi:hypothetical protein